MSREKNPRSVNAIQYNLFEFTFGVFAKALAAAPEEMTMKIVGITLARTPTAASIEAASSVPSSSAVIRPRAKR